MKTTRSENTARPLVSITAKIETPPRPEGKVLPRSRFTLPHPIDQGDCPVTLLVAPAGYGKSTLLRQWKDELDRKQVATAWFNFDAGDNDPACFLEAWIACFQRLDPRLGRDAQALLTSGSLDFVLVIDSLLADLRGWDRSSYLFLDDAHGVSNLQTQRLITDFILRAPACLGFAVGSRAMPTILPPCTATGEKPRILDAKALAFDLSETARLIEESNRLSLPEELAESVRRETEGCAAVLRLVALALRQEQEMEEFASKLGRRSDGSAQVIQYADYAGSKKISPKLEEALRRILDQVLARIARVKGENAEFTASPGAAVALIEPLTRRELEILGAIYSAQNYPAIARSLFISMHTLKWHLQNIYGKLGVPNRTAAVVKGKALGLIG